VLDRVVAREDDRARMRDVRLSTIGAVCAILTTVLFVTGGVLLSSSGVQDLIPPTGAEGLDWIADVDDASGAFFAGGWVIVLVTIVGSTALVGFYDVLKGAGQWTILAPILGVFGLVIVTISHVIPLAVAYELVPGYVDAEPTVRASLEVTFQTLASLSLLLNYVGNALGFGVAVPLFAVAILKTGALPRWIGWLGLVVAFFAGWLGLLGPASDVVEGISVIGFIGFFVFMVAMGVAVLRRERRAASASA
jgi:hypothetical protein